MLTLISDLPDRVVGVEAHGTVTAEHYEQILAPAVEAARQQSGNGKLRAMPGEVNGFSMADLDRAREWVTSPPSPEHDRFY